MTATELWLTYCQTSRANKPSTAQLVELELPNHKLQDLEDVLEHIFQQGFVEPKYRPLSWWERLDGAKVKSSQLIEELIEQGVGKCQQTALRLVIADTPPAVWVTYHHVGDVANAHAACQRVKLEALHAHAHPHTLKLAHLSNHIFAQGYLAPKLRSKVYWKGICGKRLEEHDELLELMAYGEGVSEAKPISLVIDAVPLCHDSCHKHHCH